MTRTLMLLGVLGVLTVGCQSTMSVEEAKRVTASFADAPFVPPPRTIADITAILDQQKQDTQRAEAARALVEGPPPDTTDRLALARFYLERGRTAGEIGRVRQEHTDLSKAAELAAGGPPALETEVLFRLALAEGRGGNPRRSVERFRQALARAPDRWRVTVAAGLTDQLALSGDVAEAEAALAECEAAFARSLTARLSADLIASNRASVTWARSAVAWAKGRLDEAERLRRETVEILASEPRWADSALLDSRIVVLSLVLSSQRRLLEAEHEARRALLRSLRQYGRYSPGVAFALQAMVTVLFAQGRYADAESLARAALDIHEKMGSEPGGRHLLQMRASLASALSVQGRPLEALEQHDAITAALGDDPDGARRHRSSYLGLYLGLVAEVSRARSLLAVGRPAEALPILADALSQRTRLFGEGHRDVAVIRGLLARAYAATGDRHAALREFAAAVPALVAGGEEPDDEAATETSRRGYLRFVLESYVALLAEVRGTALERAAGLDAAAEAFRVAEAARGRAVQRALVASAARAGAQNPVLADLVRRDQDSTKQIVALSGTLANALSVPLDQQNPAAIADLRARIEAARRARQVLGAEIAREFPAYAQLVAPRPPGLADVRRHLRADEALIATLVTRERTFVWAIPPHGAVAFAALPLGAKALAAEVTALRAALEPSARTLGDIPEFDVARAHRIYDTLLAPVADGWRGARSLLVVPDGALGQVPFALLPTRATALGAEEGLLFSRYRAVPWLVRTHAITVLPSVAALGTLRALPPGPAARRPFAGFGDPWFNAEQARRAAREERVTQARGAATVGTAAAPAARETRVALRDLKIAQADSARLGILPRLPDTAEEIRGIARALGADPERDVFLGARANEQAVKSLDLSRYRVIAFATHGLVPGDLDGLTQPALAFSAPEVAGTEGDGLLTMEEILALRLDADWVVLSACNTASGQGAGSEAISGLGRAFFYAGARALLVSYWPVETTSARALTTGLFARQARGAGLSRARALQETMNALIDEGGLPDPATGRVVASYAHPIFWASFSLVGDGG